MYTGEDGVDAGGLKREFLTRFMKQTCRRFLEPCGSTWILKSSIAQDEAEMVGFMLCYSIIQGGPSIEMRDYVYQNLVFGDVDKSQLVEEDVPSSGGYLALKNMVKRLTHIIAVAKTEG